MNETAYRPQDDRDSISFVIGFITFLAFVAMFCAVFSMIFYQQSPSREYSDKEESIHSVISVRFDDDEVFVKYLDGGMVKSERYDIAELEVVERAGEPTEIAARTAMVVETYHADDNPLIVRLFASIFDEDEVRVVERNRVRTPELDTLFVDPAPRP